jgi:hypothetical protein
MERKNGTTTDASTIFTSEDAKRVISLITLITDILTSVSRETFCSLSKLQQIALSDNKEQNFMVKQIRSAIRAAESEGNASEAQRLKGVALQIGVTEDQLAL